jgi:hypothetical protein
MKLKGHFDYLNIPHNLDIVHYFRRKCPTKDRVCDTHWTEGWVSIGGIVYTVVMERTI